MFYLYSTGLALAAIPVGILTAFYNILAVGILNSHLTDKKQKLSSLLLMMAKNPLILAIAAGFIVNSVNLPLPEMFTATGHYFSQLTFPLALLCIGGSIRLRHIKFGSPAVLITTGVKLLIAPALMVSALILGGVEGPSLGVFYLLTATPTAAASYIMVQAMGGDGRLAANLIVVTSVLSAITITLGLLILSSLNLI
ncbi:MAG: AEC family transporter [Pseudomonadales bacterium]